MYSLSGSVSATCKRGATVLKTLAILGAIGFSAVASAGSTLGGVITSITLNTDEGSFAFISTSASKNGTPACSTNTGAQWVLPLTSALDNQIYAQLLAALASQSRVDLYGDGVCNAVSDIETLVQVIAY
jgi:hypothetical protein